MAKQQPAQWLPDPTAAHELRYWDGNAWTDHVADAGEQATDPYVEGKAMADGAKDGGRGTFGDGVAAALYEFQASRFKGGRLVTPNVIRVWPDRVEEYKHHAVLKKHTDSIHFAQVAKVSIARGLRWTDITVESTGGHEIRLAGVPKKEAERVKTLIDEKVHSAKIGAAVIRTPAAAEAADLGSKIRELAALRDEGLLTDDEFAAQKAKLLES
jgi:hypothetical protein